MPSNVPVGPATSVGLTAAVAQFAGAAILLIEGDHSSEAVAALATAALTLVTVLAGRYAQAHAAIKGARATDPADTRAAS